jgi:hypothetical protein
MVKRVTISIDISDDARTWLSAEAARHGMTLEELAARHLEDEASAHTERMTRVRRLRPFSRASGHTDTAERAEELLFRKDQSARADR